MLKGIKKTKNMYIFINKNIIKHKKGRKILKKNKKDQKYKKKTKNVIKTHKKQPKYKRGQLQASCFL